MKKLILLVILFSCQFIYAQTDGLSYQAVILDPNAQEIPGSDITTNVLINAPLEVKFKITTEGGSMIYEEVQSTTTDAFGMINLTIGAGEATSGVFTEIEWDGTPKDLSVSINLSGQFKMLNKEKLTFIPYAFHRNITATGTLNVDGDVILGSDLIVNGTTNLNDALFVNNQSPTQLTGTLNVEGVTTLRNTLDVLNGSPTYLTGTLEVDRATMLHGTLDVDDDTKLNSKLEVDGTTILNNSLDVTNESPTTLTGSLTVNGETNLNSNVSINNGGNLNVSGNLNVDGSTVFNDDLTVNGDTNLNSTLNVNNSSPTQLTGTLGVDGETTLGNSLQVIGQTNLEDLLNVNNQSPSTLTGSLQVDLETNLNSSLAVNNGAPTFLSGPLDVQGTIGLNNNLTVNGITNLNNALFVNNQSPTNLSGLLNVTGAADFDDTLIVDGVTTLNNDMTVANTATTNLTGALNVDGVTTLNNSLDVTNASPTMLTGTLTVDEATTLNNNLTVANGSETNLSGILNVDDKTTLNNGLDVTNSSATVLTGTLNVGRATTLRGTLLVDNQSPTNLTGTLLVDGATTLDNTLTVNGATAINNSLLVTGTATLASLSTESMNVESNSAGYVATFTNTNDTNGDGIAIKLGKNHPGWNPTMMTYKSLPNPLVDPSTSPFTPITALVKNKFANPAPLTISEIINSSPATYRTGGINAIRSIIFSEINSRMSLPISLDAVPFPTQTVFAGIEYFSGITIPFVDITIPKFEIPNITVPAPSIPGVPTGSLTSIISDFIPALPGLNANGGLADISIPDFSTFTTDPMSLTKENEFVSFLDVGDRSLGSIRAQSVSDFAAATYCDPVYLLNVASGFIGVDLLDGVVSGSVALTNLIDKFNKIGVEYTSGNGDYAEWLERIAVNEYLAAGDIVAVKGGKITKDLTEVEQIMVVSHRPIILGNVPESGKEHLGNNVAFMGQVPVKVLGPVNTGDYIVASEEIAGYGKAISAKDMKANDYVLAVGRSWEENTNPGPKMVNTVVGVHNGDWVQLIKKIEAKQKAYEKQYKEIEAQVMSLDAKADALLLNGKN